jgi:hypothetical protein
MKLLIMQFSSTPISSSLLGPHILLSTLFSIPSTYMLPLKSETMFHTHTCRKLKTAAICFFPVNGRTLFFHKNPELVQGQVSISHLERTIRLQLIKFLLFS